MIVLLNGSFGIGKTTVARLLVNKTRNSTIYDPERWGYVLQRSPPWLLGLVSRPQDFQDIPQWRTLISRGILKASEKAATVIVPMAFTNDTYIDQITHKLEARQPVLKICLVAPLDVITQRLERRAQSEGRSISQFERRRSLDCVAAHRDPAFGHPINAERPPDEIAGEIACLIERRPLSGLIVLPGARRGLEMAASV
jgi:thymidylate kinase